MSEPRRRRPELLAPAGDEAALDAALAAGADAVYFGLDDGFNARAKAAGVSRDRLGEVAARVHRAGARAYLTLNTLVFESELPKVEAILRVVAASGVDAIIVQDPAVALLSRAICPALPVHASTQMTVSSPEAAGLAAALGVTRVIVPRELSVDEIRRFAAGTDLELEVFVHGAICVSWSGQCLTSEAWGGRSANRGQCAQSCRMPYDLVVDGAARDLGEVRYLLSPRDLAGFDAVPALAEMGIAGLKIEGRYKGPGYVTTAVAGYRRWLDAVDRGVTPADEAQAARDRAAMALSFSRGFGPGFLGGADHQGLVGGRFPKHRGLLLGRVAEVDGAHVGVEPGDDASAIPRPGMGVVFDAGRPQDDEPGGRIFGVDRRGDAWWLRFGRPGPDLGRVAAGQRVWLTSDAAPAAAGDGPPAGRVPLFLEVAGAAGAPLTVRVRAAGHTSDHQSEIPLEPARGAGLDSTLLAAKLGATGGTPLRLAGIDATGLGPGLHLPVSALKALRRRYVAAVMARIEAGPARTIDPAPALPRLRIEAAGRRVAPIADGPPRLIPLCRTDDQLEAALEAGLMEVELDWMERVGLARAVERARAVGRRVVVATVRVQKPGEAGYDRALAALEPDGVLVRHWGALMSFAAATPAERPAVHGDFSLNVTNSLTADLLLSRGLETVTASHDLDARQLFALLERVPAGRVAVAVHHHIPTFHTEHCVYAHQLSEGRDYRDCGRPCEHHAIGLRDHTGRVHPVVVDVACRNTVFNAAAQSAAGLVPPLIAAGVRRFRVELVRESRDEARRVLEAYGALLEGRLTAAEAIARVGAHEQFGVTRGTMKVLD